MSDYQYKIAAEFEAIHDANWQSMEDYLKGVSFTMTQPELDKLLSEAYADGRADQLEEMKEKTT